MQTTPEDYYISTDRKKLDVSFIHHFLSTQAYWSLNIPLATVKRSIEHSLCFGVYARKDHRQVGFARIITDYATIAYLGDVFIIPEHRGKGLSKRLVGEIMTHPDLQGLRRWILLTSDAHELYRKYGWEQIAHPDRYMEVANPDIYKTSTR